MINLERAYKAERFLEKSIKEEQDRPRKERLSSLLADLHECKRAILGRNSRQHVEVFLPQTLKEIERELNIFLDRRLEEA